MKLLHEVLFMFMKIKIAIVRLIQTMLLFIPVKENRIMFHANNRKGYVCNPAFLMDAIQRCKPDQFEIIWITRFPETCEKRRNVTVVRQRSWSYFFLFLRTKYFITNDMIDESLVKKRGQIFLSTWHGGGAYKKVGECTQKEDKYFAENFKKMYGRLDYFVSSCKVCTKLYADAFDLDPRIFIETGTPRNDMFFQKHPEVVQRVRDFYHIDVHTRILLFAPSFQMSDTEKEDYDIQQLEHLTAMLQEYTSEQWVILYRCHYFLENESCFSETGEISDLVKNGNSYYEMQDLLYTSDILVTDFSSCMWDFALTGRPVIVLEQNIREYEKNDRGFFIPYERWPYIKCKSFSDIPNIIREFGQSDFSDRYAEHFEEMGSFEQGNACQNIIDRIFKGQKE